MNPIFPSILSTNFFNLQHKLTEFSENKIDHIHLDVMDGHFVDNISFGPSVSTAIKSKFNFTIDAHLMVSNPRKMIPKFIDGGCDWISFHLETPDPIEENISMIKDKNCKAGLVLNPDTKIESVFKYLELLDYILLMSVFPGYGGQSFIESTIKKVFFLKKRIQESGNRCLIQIDGGINTENIKMLQEAGADLFVIGTFLYNSENINKTLQKIFQKIEGV